MEFQLVNTTDMVQVLEPREAYERPPNFTTWSEVRMGMFYTVVPSASYNTYSTSETIAYSSYLDRLCFGLSNGSGLAPGAIGSQFVGWMTNQAAGATTTNTSNNATNGVLAGTNAMKWASSNDATILTSANIGLGYGANVNYAPYSASNYASFIGLKLTVQNAGLATQTITAQMSDVGDGSGPGVGPFADVSLANLRTQLTNASYAAGQVLTWNAGGVALPIPYYWFIRLPFLNNRIRVSSMDILKIS